MTKEELEKEAEEYTNKLLEDWELYDPEALQEAYIAGATEATKKFESCLEDTIKGKNPFPNICWKLICDANDKLIEQKTKLEKENAELEQFIKTQGRKLRQQSKECDKAINRVEILAKENTALRQDWDVMKSTITDYEKENAELKKQLEMSNKVYNDNLDYSHHIEGQLTNAKEIIKELMSFSVQLCDCRHTVDFEKTREEAEQFLNSEVEK